MAKRVVAPMRVKRLEVEAEAAGAFGPLADDDVYGELLHRGVEDLLHGDAAEAVDLVDEEDVSRLQAGEQGGQVAGALDGRPEVIRIETPISAATIIASVVLPRPGGPWKSRWSSGSPRPWAAVMAMRRLSFTVSCP